MDIDLSSHGIVGLVRNHEGKFLMLKEARELLQGHWAPPHGRIEPTDPNEEATVIREVGEETGLNVKPFKKLLTLPADTKVKTVSFWLTELAEPGEIKVDPTEVVEYGWFSVEEALSLPLYPGTKLFFEKVKNLKIIL
jgi:8-oxo-dGTP pyrophosphatase MutT (NUDIX family)